MLFAPRLPLLYKKPVSYPPDQRATHKISPITSWRQQISDYKSQYGNTAAASETSKPKKALAQESLARQAAEWEDADAFAENTFLKDPYRTVFVARLYYTTTELDLSKALSGFGSIESIRIVKDKEGNSRGYGFVVFEREADAKSCIRDLASTGLAVPAPSPDQKPRKFLVDMERGCLVRSWKPRRLGGGLGGRHYTLPTASSSVHTSAAATGRRMNLSQNPYQQSSQGSRYPKRPFPSRNAPAPAAKRPANNYSHYSQNQLPPLTAYSSTSTHTQASVRAADTSIKDKYAKYNMLGESTRNIRLNNR